MTDNDGDRLRIMLAAVRQQSERNSAMERLDLLAAAWGWTREEQAAAMHRSESDLDAYRVHDAKPDDGFLSQLTALRRLHSALWASLPFGGYAAWWRRPWDASSPIGARPPLDALIDSLGALALIQAHFDGMLSGDFS